MECVCVDKKVKRKRKRRRKRRGHAFFFFPTLVFAFSPLTLHENNRLVPTPRLQTTKQLSFSRLPLRGSSPSEHGGSSGRGRAQGRSELGRRRSGRGCVFSPRSIVLLHRLSKNSLSLSLFLLSIFASQHGPFLYPLLLLRSAERVLLELRVAREAIP